MVRLRKPVSCCASGGGGRRREAPAACAGAMPRRTAGRQSGIAEVEAYGNLISLYNRTGSAGRGGFAGQGGRGYPGGKRFFILTGIVQNKHGILFVRGFISGRKHRSRLAASLCSVTSWLFSVDYEVGQWICLRIYSNRCTSQRFGAALFTVWDSPPLRVIFAQE